MITIGERITQSGVTLKALNKRSGIPLERLEQLAAGARPSLPELRKMAQALGVPVGDLVSKQNEEQHAQLLFRAAQHRLPKNQDPRPAINTFSRRIGHALSLLHLENNKASAWLRSFSDVEPRPEHAESVATLFRERFLGGDQVSPLFSLPQLSVEKLGILLFIVPQQTIDGASAVLAGRIFIFISPRFPARMLFTLAHELGHCIAHHNQAQDYAVMDDLDLKRAAKGRSWQLERFADNFASSLLMPKEGVGVALSTVRETAGVQPDSPIGDIEILFLSRIFSVSFQTAALRCESLSLIPRGGANSLYNILCKQYGSPERRAESAGLPPRPQINFPTVPNSLLDAAVKRIQDGDISIGRAANALSVTIADMLKAHASRAQ